MGWAWGKQKMQGKDEVRGDATIAEGGGKAQTFNK